MIWTWEPSCSPDVALNVVFGSFIFLRAWIACPTDDVPDRMCPVYERTPWAMVAETTGTVLVYDIPDPGLGGVGLITVEAQDYAGNLSLPASEYGDCL